MTTPSAGPSVPADRIGLPPDPICALAFQHRYSRRPRKSNLGSGKHTPSAAHKKGAGTTG